MKIDDQEIVLYSKEDIKHKKLKKITEKQIKSGCNNNKLVIISNSKDLINNVKSLCLDNTKLLMISSGNFDKINLDEL